MTAAPTLPHPGQLLPPSHPQDSCIPPQGTCTLHRHGCTHPQESRQLVRGQLQVLYQPHPLQRRQRDCQQGPAPGHPLQLKHVELVPGVQLGERQALGRNQAGTGHVLARDCAGSGLNAFQQCSWARAGNRQGTGKEQAGERQASGRQQAGNRQAVGRQQAGSRCCGGTRPGRESRRALVLHEVSCCTKYQAKRGC